MAPKRHHNQQVAVSPNHPPTRGNNNNNIASTTATSSTSSNSNLPNLPTSSSKSTVSLQPSAKKSSSLAAQRQDVLAGIWERYVSETPQRVKLLDTFMAFLVLVGALQFVYCVLVGNYVSLFFLFFSFLFWRMRRAADLAIEGTDRKSLNAIAGP